MKKLLTIMLSLTLLLSFAGCFNGEETPTDVSSVADIQTVEPQSQEVAGNGVDETQEPSIVSQPAKPASAVVSQETVNSVVSKPSANASKVEEDIVEEDLEFTTEAELKNWFKNQTQVANAVSPEALQTMQQGNTITYLRPAIPSDNGLVTFEKVVVNLTTLGYHYRFNQGEPTEFMIVAEINNSDEDFYNEFTTNLDKGKENYFRTTINGTEYLYMRNVASDAVVVVWKQNDVVHSATFDGHYDQLNQILPLLKLETVTVQTGNNHVTQ